MLRLAIVAGGDDFDVVDVNYQEQKSDREKYPFGQVSRGLFTSWDPQNSNIQGSLTRTRLPGFCALHASTLPMSIRQCPR